MKQVPMSGAPYAQQVPIPSARWSLKKLLAAGAEEWRVSPAVIIAMWALPFMVAVAGVGTGLISKDLYKWFTGEDRFAENLQVGFYALTLVLSLVITRRLWKTGQKGTAFLYFGLILGLVFMIGEELSWGQRMLGVETPESLKAINKQQETNLHNIYGVGDTFKWIQLLVGAYGTILPLVLLHPTILGSYRKTVSMLVPHYTLIPFFLLLFIWRIYRNFFEPPQKYYFAIQDYNEVMELVLAIGLFLFMIFHIRRLKT